MAYLVRNDIVQYACTCGQLRPISFLYFCRHCLKLRCGYCVCHEVESHYCSNCLEILPSAEARLKKNRHVPKHIRKCQACFDCPNCLNTLAVRGTTVSVRDPEDPSKVNSQKKYYHACFFCRWTTRDVGLPDQAVQTVSANGWAQKNTSNLQRITVLLEHAKLLGMLERHEREQREKKFTTRFRRNFSHLPGLTAAHVRKRAGLPPELPAPSTIKVNLAEFQPAVAKDTVQELPSDIFTEELDISRVTTLAQRFAQPETQPENIEDLLPMYKHLSTKQSQRCRECEHNVSKPELNPSSIKFKIQQAAYFHVPEVRFVTIEPPIGGKPSEVVILFINPSQHPTTLSFITLQEAEDEMKQYHSEGSADTSVQQGEAPPSLSSLTKPVTVVEEQKPIDISLTGEVLLPAPDIEIILPPKDDAAEYDDSGETQQFHDDPKIVIHRRANKASLRFTVVPKTDFIGENCVIGFAFRYTYVNRISSPAISTSEQKPQKVQLCTRVFMNCGKILEGTQ
ncbi:Dynactin subunit 4 [Frankliniella fusca]|uniref:Dynactin subunit 4 n=1 Tax=Frankliniella fusca TaxID=407009 RepID=A0AAE1HJH6_9NEOP|nr:Dynactin subunit 4 [Frankliniella fusca]